MKIRNDFVTNSSSSSFIVNFKNKKEMDRILNRVKEFSTYISPLEIEAFYKQVENTKCNYSESVARFIEYATSYRELVVNSYFNSLVRGKDTMRTYAKEYFGEDFYLAEDLKTKLLSRYRPHEINYDMSIYPEYRELLNYLIKKDIEEYKSGVYKRGIFGVVTYRDGSDLGDFLRSFYDRTDNRGDYFDNFVKYQSMEHD